MLCKIWGTKKKCLHNRSGGKKLASGQSMVEKISCVLEITIPPPPTHPRGKNNGPSLMNPALGDTGSRIHKILSTLSKVIGDGGTLPPPFIL